MCEFFDTAAPQQCREPVADLVSDKQRANFCGYFQVNPHAFSEPPGETDASRQQLDALFGGESSTATSETRTADDAAREQLEKMFKE
jgi:hypothetical protein